jgi:hypothetical protein
MKELLASILVSVMVVVGTVATFEDAGICRAAGDGPASGTMA